MDGFCFHFGFCIKRNNNTLDKIRCTYELQQPDITYGIKHLVVVSINIDKVFE